MAQNKVKESYIKSALSADFATDSVNSIKWTESAGAGLADGFTTEIIAVKGTAEINGKTETFSYVVKMAPESGYMAQMVKEVNKAFQGFYGLQRF